MKNFCTAVILTICLLLSACGRSGAVKSAYDEFSDRLNDAEELSFSANVRAEYEHKSARFALQYTEDESGGSVTVTAPELIAGISARIAKGGTRLVYGDVSLETGALDEHGLSPMSAMPLLVSALRAGYFDSCRSEDGKIALQLVINDDYICTVWFDEEITAPLRAELLSDGRVVIYADISEWKMG